LTGSTGRGHAFSAIVLKSQRRRFERVVLARRVNTGRSLPPGLPYVSPAAKG
jgi:hypothetical protein